MNSDVPSSGISGDRIIEKLPRGRHALSREEVFASQRRRMLDAVGLAVARKGYGATVVDDVIKGAGVSRKTFYEHFTDIQDCFLQAYSDFGDALLALNEAAVRFSDRGGFGRLGAATRAVFGFLMSQPELARAFFLDAVSAGPDYSSTRNRIFAGFADRMRLEYEMEMDAEPRLPKPLPGAYEAAAGMNAEIVIAAILADEEVDLEQMVEQSIAFTMAILLARQLNSNL